MVGSSPKNMSRFGKWPAKYFGHFEKNGKVGKFADEKSREPCSFGWEMVRDEDLKSWEFVDFQSVWTMI